MGNNKLKQISLREIQSRYFEIIGKYFGKFYREMRKHNLTSHQIAIGMSSIKSVVEELCNKSEEFENVIVDFWEKYGKTVEIYINNLKGLKTVYGGDIFPSYRRNILSSTGLYVDTTILPDPSLRVATLFGVFYPERRVYYLIKHALSVLLLKDIVLADVDPPIAIIAPDYIPIDEHITEYVKSIGEEDLIFHMGKAFGKKFKDMDMMNQYLSKLNNISTFKKELKIPNKILFDTDWKELPLEDQWTKCQEKIGELKPVGDSPSIGEGVKMFIYGRMMHINETVYKANRFNGNPLIDAPTSWQYFLWKYEYDQERSKQMNPELNNTLMVNALQDNKLLWLGEVPNNALIKLRKEGAVRGFREVLSKGISRINNVDENEYKETVNGIVSNIDEAIGKHKKELDSLLRETKKYYGYDVLPWLVTGCMAIATIFSKSIPLAIGTIVTSKTIGDNSLKDLWKKGKEIKGKKQEIKRSPAGILFEAKEKVKK